MTGKSKRELRLEKALKDIEAKANIMEYKWEADQSPLFAEENLSKFAFEIRDSVRKALQSTTRH